MEPMWETVRAAIHTISPIPTAEWEAFRAIAVPRAIAKQNHFVREGEPTDVIGLCVSGLFRLYYTTSDGGEFNKSFCTKQDFVASYSSLLLGAPSF
ncbi:MAG: putative transcriptional regulator, Crp/Fnr family [Paenibacillus sp.]|nr:putative transcriptional regulator, Crp/Fnr family [Paenibacillus sp.]